MCGGKLTPFFQESCFRVTNKVQSNRIAPSTRITAEEEIVIALTLAKSGLYGSNPQTVLESPVDIVMHSFHYNNFMQDYEETSIELNKESK